MKFLTATITAAIAAAILPAQNLEERLRKLEEDHRAMKEAHSKEIERLQFGRFVPALGGSKFGMGPAASKVYGQDEGISIGGYGEFLYQQRSGTSDRFDALRTVLYVGYRFDQNWVLNSEIEYEHAGSEVAVEFSYLEYMHDKSFNARAGLLLVPMGFINEMHEPTTYLPSSRPLTETNIIPSTWRETGVGAHGSLGDFDYKATLITSLNGEKFDSSGLRGGRQKGNRSAADDFAFVGRLDWHPVQDLTVGAALFYGDTGQDGLDASSNVIPALTTTIVEGHAEYQANGFVVRGLFAEAHVKDTGTFNANTGGNLAKVLRGYYVEVGYDVMQVLAPDSGAALLPFVRYERNDTQATMARGFSADPTKDETLLTFGLHYRPIDQVVIKADYVSADEGRDSFQIGFGYVF